ncbi:Wall-associated receptor kinase 2 [Rhynchospora pubera]|uniref:Wall-associated receptor kinase 2 n=1 Tax=Rhynchospora pubera TaxID=906938 RepID=A0AAV8CI46_9POAL|nr:Wall-associated receptor kinase 2 [Rhynchospora pubera]
MILIIQLLLLISPSKTKAAEFDVGALPGCPDSCGGVTIPYPFGIGPNCSLSEVFELICKATINGTFAPHWGDFMLLDISLTLGQARMTNPISSQCYNRTTKKENYNDWKFDSGAFWFNHEKNKFFVIGCDTLAYVNFTNDENSYLGGCVSGCNSLETLTDGSCSGIGCCETSIPKGPYYLNFWFDDNFNSSMVSNFSPCSHALLREEAGFMFNTD